MNTQETIAEKIRLALSPDHLEVINESHMHSVPANSETHFKVIVVSDEFVGDTLVKRHRKLNKLLADELNGGVHALGLHTHTAAEWQSRQGHVADSPECRGGSR